MSQPLTDEQYRSIYAWIDAIPLSRPKRNIARDFSDGLLLAEVVAAYFPHLVEIHNYPAANSVKQKVYNLETLNLKVFKKLGFSIPHSTIEDIVNCKPGSIEQVLNTLQYKMAKYRERKAQSDSVSPKISGKDIDDIYSMDPREQDRSFEDKVNRTPKVKDTVDKEILIEKEKQIRELQATVELLELKVAKLEQLVRLKDNKIQKLMTRNIN